MGSGSPLVADRKGYPWMFASLATGVLHQAQTADRVVSYLGGVLKEVEVGSQTFCQSMVVGIGFKDIGATEPGFSQSLHEFSWRDEALWKAAIIQMKPGEPWVKPLENPRSVLAG